MNGVRFDWKAGDIFALPAWTLHEHVNTSETEEAVLFSTNDLPIMEVFGFEREKNCIKKMMVIKSAIGI